MRVVCVRQHVFPWWSRWATAEHECDVQPHAVALEWFQVSSGATEPSTTGHPGTYSWMSPTDDVCRMHRGDLGSVWILLLH